jgi:hypothetical protein
MRPAHIRLVAIAGVLAVVVGVATAFVVGRDNPAQPAALASPTTTSVTPATDNKTTPGKGNDPAPTPTSKPPVDQPDRAAKAAAGVFMR